MIIYHTQGSEIPNDTIILETKVLVNTNITPIEIIFDEETRIEYEYDVTEYTKDEYIEKIAKDNEELNTELTDAQLALCELYEMLL